MKEYTEERQLDLFNADSTSSRNLANRGDQDLDSRDWKKHWKDVEKATEKVRREFKKEWKPMEKVKRIFEGAKQMAFNFDLKFIIDMKRASEEAKRMIKEDFSLIGITYQNALSVVFKMYQKWKLESVFTLNRIPSYVFIQE